MKPKQKRSRRFDESKTLRETFAVSSYGCVDADFDKNDEFVLDLKDDIARGRF